MIRILLTIATLLTLAPKINAEDDQEWTLIVDAGSSGTRMRIFRWKTNVDTGDIPNIEQYLPMKQEDRDKLEVHPGISSFASNSTKAKEQIRGLIEEAKRWVPYDVYSKTSIRLGATAGMRLLPTNDQTSLMNAVSEALKESVFSFGQGDARILSGEEEASFGWLSMNYIFSHFEENKATVGIMDMGGASTQIAFEPTVQIMADEFSVKVLNRVHRVYATSYLKYGNDQFKLLVLESIKSSSSISGKNESVSIPNPCQCFNFAENFTLSGDTKPTFFNGTGDWDECKKVTDALMYPATPCFYVDPSKDCAVNGNYMSELTGNFYAINSLFYTASGLGLVKFTESATLSLSQFESAGKTWCAKRENAASNSHAPDYCRNSAYIVSLLNKAYGFDMNDSTSVKYAKDVNGFNVDWTLGLAIFYEEALRSVICSEGTHLSGEYCVADPEHSGSSNKLGEGVGVGVVITVVAFAVVYVGMLLWSRKKSNDDGGAVYGDLESSEYDAM